MIYGMMKLRETARAQARRAVQFIRRRHEKST
jgi:hypothetical protein